MRSKLIQNQYSAKLLNPYPKSGPWLLSLLRKNQPFSLDHNELNCWFDPAAEKCFNLQAEKLIFSPTDAEHVLPTTFLKILFDFLNCSPWTWLAMCGAIPYLRWAGRRTKRGCCPTTATNSSLSMASLPASQLLPSPRRTLANTPSWWRTSTAQRPASSLSACTTQRKMRPRRGIKAKRWMWAMIDTERKHSPKHFTPAHVGDHQWFKYMLYVVAFSMSLLPTAVGTRVNVCQQWIGYKEMCVLTEDVFCHV